MSATVHPEVTRVTERIRARSRLLRAGYLDRIARAAEAGPRRRLLPCSNFAHGFAACPAGDKEDLRSTAKPNVGIVTAYNDMLSAHQPLGSFPDQIKAAARAAGGVAQVAGGVPAMCDGVTQGTAAMELSLLSRDVIAMGTAIALSHGMFDAAICLGVCDKIVPGLLIGALSFGHLPVVFATGGPMPSGLSNSEKARVRQRHAAGEVGDDALLASEAASYHAPGTCTFYGTANSNQMLMEVMGLHLPGASFVNPGTPLRDALTAATARRAVELARTEPRLRLGEMLDERALVNGVVALLATGGSTNHTLHLVAVARAAGLVLDWEDFDALARVVPLVARVYPNGLADVNRFAEVGGMPFVIGELLGAGLLHPDVRTVAGDGLEAYTRPIAPTGGELAWGPPGVASTDATVLRPAADPFQPEAGLRLLTGNLGRAIGRSTAVAAKHRRVEAPAAVFDVQDDFHRAFHAGELDRDVVAVVRFQGPRVNGMPELHKLMPPMGVLQDKGFHVALVTDGRLSGASGKVPSAIHVTPEAWPHGPLARLRDGDRITVDLEAGILTAAVDGEELRHRTPVPPPLDEHATGVGRELFASLRAAVRGAEEGAVSFGW